MNDTRKFLILYQKRLSQQRRHIPDGLSRLLEKLDHQLNFFSNREDEKNEKTRHKHRDYHSWPINDPQRVATRAKLGRHETRQSKASDDGWHENEPDDDISEVSHC